MKKNRFLILVLVLLGITSCTKDEHTSKTDVPGLTEEVYFELVGDIQSIGLKEHYQALIQEASQGNDEGDEQLLEFALSQLDATEKYEEECINLVGANWESGPDGEDGRNRLLGYRYATLRYKSIDHTGSTVMLSTLVVWPYNNILADPDASNIIIGCHVTIGSNAERPSNYSKNDITTDVGMLACCAKSNGSGLSYENLVVIPDYQGYGATHGEVHPYLSQELTARQVLDGVRAGKAFYEKELGHKLKDGWKSLSTGYSQGGSVAMAVHKYIEENNLTSEFNFVGSVCGSGPYDPIATLQKYVNEDKLYMPVAAAMMIHSMCETNPRLMGKYKVKDYITEAFINTKIFDNIKSKAYDTDQINDALLEHSAEYNLDDETSLCMYRKAGKEFYPYRKDTKEKYVWDSGNTTSYAIMSDCFRPEVINWMKGEKDPAHKDKMEALMGALNDNVLYNDWTPAHPIILFHTYHDEVVPIENYRSCLNSWENSPNVKGVRYMGLTMYHVAYGKAFYVRHCGWGIESILGEDLSEFQFDGILLGLY